MQCIEVEAKTVEEAIELACSKLKTTKEKLDIEVIENAPNKLFSLFSSKKAKIKATILGSQTSKKDSAADIEPLKEILETIVKKIHSESHVTITHDNDNNEIIFNIIGDGSGIFIGKKGQTLESFQYLINKIRLSRFRELPHITVDSESYRMRHVDSLVSLAMRLSDKAKKRQGPVTTNPLSPGDRRIIHLTLKKDVELTTWSKGEGNLKKVIIAPK